MHEVGSADGTSQIYEIKQSDSDYSESIIRRNKVISQGVETFDNFPEIMLII